MTDQSEPKPKLDKRFLVERNGKNFALYAGLLGLAHDEHLDTIATNLIQIPSDENGRVAIVQATVKTARGTFMGLGDAAPENVARPMVTCLIRMAETRAKARALRDAVNVGVAALEELGNDTGGDDEHEAWDHDAHSGAPVAAERPQGGGDLASEKQVRYLYALGRDKGLSEPQVDERTLAQYGRIPAEMGKRDIGDLITRLKDAVEWPAPAKPAAQPAQPAPQPAQRPPAPANGQKKGIEDYSLPELYQAYKVLQGAGSRYGLKLRDLPSGLQKEDAYGECVKARKLVDGAKKQEEAKR